jgi:hypothetical protein
MPLSPRTSPSSLRRAAARVACAAILLAAAYGLFQGRKALVRSFFPRGPGGAPPPALEGSTAARPTTAAPGGPSRQGLPAAPIVRVVLLDGVDRETALRLPHYDDVCRRGLELVIDVGFPTVSLPVQSVLWTGLTQQQSGIQFVQGRIDPPPEGSLPAREPSSAAVAQSHAFISQSFGFARGWPPVELDKDRPALAVWEAGPFAATALGLAGSATRLVFVHLLGPDDAGHRHGRDSPEFAAAAAEADRVLGDLLLVDRAAHAERSLWLVLADHGHRGPGGHGGEEPAIRLVRGCLLGPGVPAGPQGRLVHLVDVSRALADALGQVPHPASAGRPLLDALAARPQPDATLPEPSPLRAALAALLLGAALAVTWVTARRSWNLPWWWVLAYLSVVGIETAPSLSTPMIYRPQGQSIYVAALPGLCVLAIVAGMMARRSSPLRLVATQLLVPAALAGACALLCWGEPPLLPFWTANLSVSLVLLFSGAAVAALACLAALVPYGSDRATPAETPDTPP